MANPHAEYGDVIDVGPLGAALSSSTTQTLLKTDQLQLVRMVMPQGKEIAEHKAPGPITVQCLEGKIAFTTLGKTQELVAGQMLCLPAEEQHALKCLEEVSFLLTLWKP